MDPKAFEEVDSEAGPGFQLLHFLRPLFHFSVWRIFRLSGLVAQSVLVDSEAEVLFHKVLMPDYSQEAEIEDSVLTQIVVDKTLIIGQIELDFVVVVVVVVGCKDLVEIADIAVDIAGDSFHSFQEDCLNHILNKLLQSLNI